MIVLSDGESAALIAPALGSTLSSAEQESQEDREVRC